MPGGEWLGLRLRDERMPLTVGIVVAAKPDHHEPLFLGKNGLVDMPSCSQVRQNDRTHGGGYAR